MKMKEDEEGRRGRQSLCLLCAIDHLYLGRLIQLQTYIGLGGHLAIARTTPPSKAETEAARNGPQASQEESGKVGQGLMLHRQSN